MNPLRTNDTVLHFSQNSFWRAAPWICGAESFEFFGTQKIKKKQQKFAKSYYPLYSFIRDFINVYGILLIQKLNTNVKFC